MDDSGMVDGTSINHPSLRILSHDKKWTEDRRFKFCRNRVTELVGNVISSVVWSTRLIVMYLIYGTVFHNCPVTLNEIAKLASKYVKSANSWYLVQGTFLPPNESISNSEGSYFGYPGWVSFPFFLIEQIWKSPKWVPKLHGCVILRKKHARNAPGARRIVFYQLQGFRLNIQAWKSTKVKPYDLKNKWR